MKRSDRRRHAGTSALMAHWPIDHQSLDIFVEIDGHTGVVDLVIEVDLDSWQITSMDIAARPTDASTPPRTENPGCT